MKHNPLPFIFCMLGSVDEEFSLMRKGEEIKLPYAGSNEIAPVGIVT